MEENRKTKKVADSLTEVTKLLQYKDINGYERLFGGRLMCWIDEVAGLVGRRHAQMNVTTGTVENLSIVHGLKCII